MSILILSISLIAVALLALGGALKSLIAAGWFLKWLRGTGGFTLILIALIGAALGYELLTFYKSDEGKVIATLTFDRTAEQEFDLELVDAHGKVKRLQLLGDQWQLDVRLVKVSGLGETGQPSYKLDRISGRYLSLEQEKQDQRSVHDLSASTTLDLWQVITKSNWLPLLKASYGSAAFMPMADGAIYQVRLFEKGLVAEPVNDRAKQALESW
jgi:hypothetical protein